MKEYTVIIGENGRMIIPALFRKTLDLKAGDEVIVKLSSDNNIVIHSPKQSLRKLQELLKSQNNQDNSKKESLVDALLQMRRKEEI